MTTRRLHFKRFLSILLVCFMILGFTMPTYAESVQPVMGTKSNVIEIASAADIPDEIAEGQTYILTNDITLTDQQIGTLAGTLDGQGHVITLSGNALANNVTGTIQNLGLKGIVTISSGDSASMAIQLSGTIKNSYSEATVLYTGFLGYIGGLVGTLSPNGKIQNSYFAGSAKDNFGIKGGMVATGKAAGTTIRNSYSKGIELFYSGSGETIVSSEKKDEAAFKSPEMIKLLNTDIEDTGYVFAYSEGNYPVLQASTGTPDTPDPTVDKSKLEQAISDAENQNEKDYTAESWAAMKAALESAKYVKEQEDATQAAVDDAAKTLNDAVAALVRKPIRQPIDKPENESEIVKITSAADFHAYAKKLGYGTTTGKYLVLMNDIEIDSSYGNGIAYATLTNFSGVLDGQGHSIIFKDVKTPLFAGVNYGAVVQNIAFTGKLSIDAGNTMGPMGSNFAGYFLNSYTNIEGKNVYGLAGKLSSGAVLSNCFSAGDMTGGAAFSKTDEGAIIENVYFVDTLSSACGTAMSEDAMKTLNFVASLNANRGENGIAWGRSSTGYPYFGENQDYTPNTDPYLELPGESLYEAVFTPYGETEAQIIGEERRLQVSPQQVDAFKVSGKLSLPEYETPDGSELIWTIVDAKPSDSILVAENSGELFVYKNGKAVVAAAQKDADGTVTYLAYVSVLATSQKITGIRLLIDGADVTNGSFTVQGSQSKQVQVEAKFEDTGDLYQKVAFNQFKFEVGDSNYIFSRSDASNSFYFKKPGTSFVQVTSRDNPDITARIDLTSEYVAVESVMPALHDEYVIHGRNANSDGQEADGRIAYNPIQDNVIVTPAYATNADKVTVTSENEQIGYYASGSKVYVPKEAGTVTFTAMIEDINPTTGEVNKVSGSKTVTFKYLNTVTKAETDKTELTVECNAQETFDVVVTGARDSEGYSVTEPALEWKFDKKGIAQIVSKTKGTFKRETGSPDDNMYFPEMEYRVIGLSEGTVTATGTPIDKANKVEPVTIKITVTKGSASDVNIDALVSDASEKAHQYIAESHSTKGYTYGNEWLVFAELRAGNEIKEDVLKNYYDSVAAEVKTWNENHKPTDIERVILALTVMGKDITDVEGINLAEMVYNHSDLASGSNELTYSLLALDAANFEIPSDAVWSREKIVKALLKFQNPSTGGFGLYDNTGSSVDMTAMALQALANYQSNREVKAATDKALEYLKGQQQDDFGFGSSESSAQVLLALALLNISPISEDAGFGVRNFNIITNLMEYQKPDGGFAHIASSVASGEMSTVQSLHGLDAYRMGQSGTMYWNVNGPIRWEIPNPGDGSIVVPSVPTESNNTSSSTITNEDGSQTIKETTTVKNEAGNEVEVTTTTTKDTNGEITGVTEKSVIETIAENTTATVTVRKDADGQVKSSRAEVITKVDDNTTKVTLSGKVVEQIETASDTKNVTITMAVKNSEGDTKYTVKVASKNLTAGNKLYVYKVDEKTGERVLVNNKLYTVSEDGSVIFNTKQNADFVLVNKATAAATNKAIKQAIAPAKAETVVKAGKTTRMAMNSELNMANVKKITYATNKSSVASISANGKITAKKAGVVYITAKVTLKNGYTKSVRMKVTVK